MTTEPTREDLQALLADLLPYVALPANTGDLDAVALRQRVLDAMCPCRDDHTSWCTLFNVDGTRKISNAGGGEQGQAQALPDLRSAPAPAAEASGEAAPEHPPLRCHACGKDHHDDGEWATRPHRTHRCVDDKAGKGCGHEWRVEPAAPREGAPCACAFATIIDGKVSAEERARSYHVWRYLATAMFRHLVACVGLDVVKRAHGTGEGTERNAWMDEQARGADVYANAPWCLPRDADLTDLQAELDDYSARIDVIIEILDGVDDTEGREDHRLRRVLSVAERSGTVEIAALRALLRKAMVGLRTEDTPEEIYAVVSEALALTRTTTLARDHRLAWNGTEWVAPCGCRYHPEDDNGTHGGAPHVHPCASHAGPVDVEAPVLPPGFQVVSRATKPILRWWASCDGWCSGEFHTQQEAVDAAHGWHRAVAASKSDHEDPR